MMERVALIPTAPDVLNGGGGRKRAPPLGQKKKFRPEVEWSLME
jgi:hypothetical protein